MAVDDIAAFRSLSDVDQEDLIHRLSSLRRQANAAGKGEEAEKLREACEGFEAILLRQIWRQMRSSVPKDGLMHSREEEFYLSMFDDKMADFMVQGGGIGLADALYENLMQQMDIASSGDERGMGERVPVTPPDPAWMARPDPVSEESGQAGLPPFDPEAAGARDPDVMARVEALAARIVKEGRAVDETAAGGIEIRWADARLGNMSWPLDGRVSSDFGWRKDPFTGKTAWHSGIDIAAQEGRNVSTCWDGRVIFSGWRGGYGNLVVVEHAGGWRSYYGHNKVNTVSEGDLVRAGQVIAEVGSTGRSTGSHRHFELRQGDQAWNPRMIRSRLLAGLHVGQGSVQG